MLPLARLLAPVLLTLSLASFAAASQAKHTFDVQGGKFMLDGKPFQILAGEIHPSRVPHQYWRQRIQMAKAMGLNTISVYLFWNMHEPEKGHFNFKGDEDFASFIRICQQEGMFVMLRPGPYVCAEWEFGGYPYWLLNEPGLVVRSKEPKFMAFSKRYLEQIAKQSAALQITHGGNILMVQVENEYGSYGHDKEYMSEVRDDLKQVGFDVPLYVAEGGPQLASAWIPGTIAGVNGGGWPDTKRTADRYTPGGPYMVPEFYPGWLDHWGEPFSTTDGGVGGYTNLISHGVSVSMYVFHGGTNFGFMNGANFGGSFEPDITSYDYDAPLDEAGHPRRKYFAFREAIAKVTGKTPPPLPATEPVIAIPPFPLTETADLLTNLLRPVRSENVMTMESLGQAYGFVLYRTHLKGPKLGTLEVKDVRDFAIVMVNGTRIATLDRRHKEQTVTLDLQARDCRLDILVENGGRINYGGKIPDNHKGITEKVTFGGEDVKGWENYSLPMKDVSHLRPGSEPGNAPKFYRGSFEIASPGDTFLDMRGWTKGVVWINGHNLGRYWKIGPQQTLYVPGVWLKKGRNDIVVFEQIKTAKASVQGLTDPILNELHPEPRVTKRPRVKLPFRPTFDASELAFSGQMADGDAAQRFRFDAPKVGRYLCLETDSTFANETFSALSELDLLAPDGFLLDRAAWRVASVDSEETAQEDGSAENLLDGDAETIWHTVWSADHIPLPHRVVIDLGAEATASGVRLTPRQGDHPGKVKGFKIYFLKPSG